HGAGAATLKSGLERDFVVFETRVRRRRTGWTRRCRAARRTALATAATLGAIPVAAASATTASVSAASATAAVSTAFAAPAGAAEHLHLVGDDLGGVAFDAFLVRVLVGAQRAFHVHLPAFLQVLAGDLREPTEELHAVPLGAFLLLAGLLVPPAFGRRDTDGRDRAATGGVARF